MQEFLALAGSTLQSFLATYGRGEMPGETSEEAQFVLALCGIITSERARKGKASLVPSPSHPERGVEGPGYEARMISLVPSPSHPKDWEQPARQKLWWEGLGTACETKAGVGRTGNEATL